MFLNAKIASFWTLATRPYPTEQVQSIVQPEICIHFADFRFEGKIWIFQQHGILEKKNPENVSELPNLWFKIIRKFIAIRSEMKTSKRIKL